jgi:hypothetical protein
MNKRAVEGIEDKENEEEKGFNKTVIYIKFLNARCNADTMLFVGSEK